MTRRSRQEWKTLIEQHESSGQTLAEFSQEHRLKRATFIWWRKVFRRESRKTEGVSAAPIETSTPRTQAKTRRSRQEWKRIVSSWMESGETAATYAAKHELKVNTLRWWKSELFGKSRGSNSGSRPKSTPRAVRGTEKTSMPLTEPLVDMLAEASLMGTADLTKRLGASYRLVLRELRELEDLGIVFRTGKGPGAQWGLG